ncbi:MAG: HD domain-containing protein [Deltaproteobacteria bacterium]|nr:HD domain-containing protein [Deltaproteobacteria bacterium]
MKANESLLDLVLETQILDRVPRSGYFLRGVPDPESVTEHSWHVLFLVWALGSREDSVDLTRAMEIALLHDIAEVRIGDLPRTAGRYFDKGAKARAETAAMAEILAPLPDRSRKLYAEYCAAETAEARLVKACDKLQLMIKVLVYETWGAGGLGEFWENEANFPSSDFQSVRELTEELRERYRQRA